MPLEIKARLEGKTALYPDANQRKLFLEMIECMFCSVLARGRIISEFTVPVLCWQSRQWQQNLVYLRDVHYFEPKLPCTYPEIDLA